MKTVLKAASILTVGLVVGALIGVWITSRGYERYVLNPIRYEKANVAGIHVNILSMLRIDANDEAIEHLETMLDNETLVMTQQTNDPDRLPEEVVRVLKWIKAYRKLYPAEGQRAGLIEDALADIPNLTHYKKECEGGLCRLLDAQRADTGQPAGTDETPQP